MKNITYLPFERNHYYYGKLLTVEDFELEQRYCNNKRRLSNRFLYGNGVVNGMTVVGIDDQTISIERGIAIDFAGREIVVEESVTKKLSNIEGFGDYKETDQPYVYLCIEYDEKEKEVVYNIAGGNQSNESKEFNKIKESYRLFLSCYEPKSISNLSNTDIYQEKSMVYTGNGIRIYHSTPKFVKIGESFDLQVEIENIGQQQDFAFSYEMDLGFLKYKGQPKLKVDFDEKLFSKASRYLLTYRLSVLDVQDVTATAEIISESFRISVARNRVNGNAKGKSETFIVKNSVIEATADRYYRTEMDHILNNTYQQYIYLAKIIFIRAGTSYVIHEIENLPYHQKVWNNNLSFAVNQLIIKELDEVKKIAVKASLEDKKDPIVEKKQEDKKISFGSIELEIGRNKKRGKTFFSEEILHGLGIGNVCIKLGIENNPGEVIYGSSEVFLPMEPMLELAAKVNIEKGTFIIGARLLEINKKENCTIHWTAIKDPDYMEQDQAKKEILIRPNVLNLNVRETHYLEAVCKNMNDKRLTWTAEPGGGIIDRNGMYTAPDSSGVYEVQASSLVYPNVKSSIFIVVRDDSEKSDSSNQI